RPGLTVVPSSNRPRRNFCARHPFLFRRIFGAICQAQLFRNSICECTFVSGQHRMELVLH
ncbi:unnamed protein product, partial [Plutella xylostella]